MINIKNEKDCCGCSACSTVCPKQCISMVDGSLGHLFPSVDSATCIDCGLCEHVCPMKNDLKSNGYVQKAFAAYSKCDDVRFSGSSGGMFATFANKLFEEGYIVFGAAFDEDLKLKCSSATTNTELSPLTKSKYLQSDISDKFSEIKERLDIGEKVFITATPCQIAALKSYLKKDYENLLTADFFCHGVPSQKFFDKCLNYDETTKYGGEVTSYTFRQKIKNGATPHYFSLKYIRNGKQKQKTGYYFESTFYAFFQKYICLRESCYNCTFSGQKRLSDITIADFHDVDNYISGINRFDGVSTVIVNSPKGKMLFDSCTDTLFVKQLDLDKLISDGVCFSGGTKRPNNRDAFLRDYKSLSIKDLSKKYVHPRNYLKMRIYYTLPSNIRKILKRLVGE